VTLFEKNDRIGGLLRYGIPDFKMEKHLIDRRVEQMAAEGVEFRPSVEVGVTVGVGELLAEYDALALTGGAELPRDLEVPSRALDGIHFAMDFLPQQNKRNAGDDEIRAAPGGMITASGKHVIVIGGGDTGSDCIGTATRQGAASITQLEIVAGGGLRARLGGADQRRARVERPCRGAGMRPGRMEPGAGRALGDAGDPG
jgi:glutamate synthase (NADPH/NADH) small chain